MKMRRIILKICLVLICLSAITQTNLDEKTRKIIAANKVKAVTNYNFNYVDGAPSKSGQKTAYKIYNSSGYLVEVKAFNSNTGTIWNADIMGYSFGPTYYGRDYHIDILAGEDTGVIPEPNTVCLFLFGSVFLSRKEFNLWV